MFKTIIAMMELFMVLCIGITLFVICYAGYWLYQVYKVIKSFNDEEKERENFKHP